MQLHQFVQPDQVLTVSQLNREVRSVLERNFSTIWVEGEISNFAAPHSGHWYFSLKDATAQVRCAMFRMHQRKLQFLPKDGMHVLVKAKVSLYENRGEFQLTVEDMEERGEGKLQRAFLAMKKKLESAGLFAQERKKPIPPYPQSIGIITSATGAAIRDILNALRRRYLHAAIIIYPTLVQGAAAAPHIVKAIQIANRRKECDVLILARGGGSLEDLWPFNEEIVAHAISASELPIVSGIGHEVDFTIADFVCDMRASTPTAAAEMITPDSKKIIEALLETQNQLNRMMTNRIGDYSEKLKGRYLNLSHLHPKNRIQQRQQYLDDCAFRLKQHMSTTIQRYAMRVEKYHRELQHHTPKHQIHGVYQYLEKLQQQLNRLVAYNLHRLQINLGEKAAHLNAISPLATLNRGFAIVSDETQKIITNSANLNPGDRINIRLAKGRLHCDVVEID